MMPFNRGKLKATYESLWPSIITYVESGDESFQKVGELMERVSCDTDVTVDHDIESVGGEKTLVLSAQHLCPSSCSLLKSWSHSGTSLSLISSF